MPTENYDRNISMSTCPLWAQKAQGEFFVLGC
jgi:hypothetical protein